MHSSDIGGVHEQLRRYRPTFLLAVPRVLEEVYDQARRQTDDARRGWLFNAAEQVAERYSRALDDHGGPGVWLRLAHGASDRVAYRALRDSLGGRCRTVIVGGAPMDERLSHFFRGAGVRVLEATA